MEILTAGAAETLQRRIAGGLRAHGIREGDRVAVLLPGSAAALALSLAALRTAVVPVPLDPGLTPSERAALLDDAAPALVVADQDRLSALLQGREADLANVPLARPMHYTSGTTGRPKGVWSGVLDEPAARALVAEERELWRFDALDRHLVLSPLHHSAPLRFAMGTLLAGGTVLLPGPFSAESALAAIAAHRPTSMFCVPAQLQRLFAAVDGRRRDLPSLASFRLVAHAGAPCPEPLKRRTIDAFPAGTVWEFYGSTEGQFTACPAEEWLERPGTVGRARPGRRLSVDPDGTIWCAVPPYARFSYWRDPQRTATAWRGHAFTVGDLGRLDREGFLYLDGRREDLIISGGVNVYPAEVEHVIAGCPGVHEVAVFGVPDQRWGQRVCAAVVGVVDTAQVWDWAHERLAPAKRPKEIHLVAELPRTATGKVRRLELPAVLGMT